ncbi:type VI secretion protein IcmF/TssM N-terminal domain-containing protein [Dyella soli]|uniref:IcmF-related N-terminal domain-containing protein n=1 Tax=Dyella soli TaxID=522319 RepID=A0A4R0YLG1_9GAMM|nr:type VI secretion protein IcmF/TssM N-terminal domain-containing protein [Dyella soli]TCI06930.1 hypothetical protein EZM97_30370 [Dyella soli]
MRLLECFAPLFSLGLAIDDQPATPVARDELAPLQTRVRVLIEQARSMALAQGKAMTDVEIAGFAVVAWFDEIVMRQAARLEKVTPLQVSLFHTGNAASEFFDQLARLEGDAEEVREVYGMALLLGFTGQYYYEKNDSGELGRIKALHCRPYAGAASLLQSLHRDAITPQPYVVPDSPARRLPAPWAGSRPSLLVAATVVFLVLVTFVAPVFSGAMSAQAWYLAGVAVALAGALGWGGAQYWHQRAVMRAVGNPESGYGWASAWASLVSAARRARGAVLHPFRRRGSWGQLSRRPWLLFLGDRAANVEGLLQAASHAAHARKVPGDNVSRPWPWWVFKSLVAIHADPRLVEPQEDMDADASSWSRGLGLVARERRKLPLDGIVLCISVHTLLERGEPLAATAARLRDLARDATTRLQLQLPAYIVVTGLESLPGHAAFKAALPSAVLRRVLGWRVPMADGSHGRLDGYLESMAERIRAVGLAALSARRDLHGRREVYEFVRALLDLRHGLREFIDALAAGDESTATRLRCCGVYLTGTPSAGAPGGEFVGDLFSRFLPGDWILARRTG